MSAPPSQPPYNPAMAPPVDSKNMGDAPPPYPGPPAFPQQQYPPVTGQQQYPPYPPPTSSSAYPQQTYSAYPPAPQHPYGAIPQQPQPQPQQTIVVTAGLGNCPSCRVGNLVETTDGCSLCCIIFLVIIFFPIGLLYLLCLPGATERRCPSCGYRSG